MNPDAIALSGVRKRFGSIVAVDAIDLEIASGEFFSLLGPSGCGKTTLLRLIAGFETPDDGELRIGGRPMNSVPPRDRPVCTVFQNYALFPHLSVFENVAFGLRVRKVAPGGLTIKVMQTLEMLHVAELKDRFPAQISGGQKQRVALARALAVQPQVLLLDEPLAAVDARRRAQVQEDLRRVQRKTGITFLYVTHDQDEALSLSDRLAVMDAGKIVQLGTPREIYDRPKTLFVATFVGRCNSLRGTVVRRGSNESYVQTPVGCLRVSQSLDRTDLTLGIRAERILFNVRGNENLVSGRVESISYTGALTEYGLVSEGHPLRVAVTGRSGVAIHDEVRICLPADALFPLEEP